MPHPKLKHILRALIISGCCISATAAAEPSTFVDEQGILRRSSSREEVAQFGVNYSAPFAHAFRAHRRLGVPIERAIDADVYHLARLGLDAYRIHVWDREISDGEGNLLENDHVRAFDYLLAQLKKRGFKIILTPLQFGNAGYPEGGVELPGFSSRYGKRGCLEDRESWPLQERYLSQFVSHVNPHTGLAYKDDPDIIAFEICNEPGHFEYEPTLEYINRMTQAIRGTGCAAPVFYNMSHGLPVFDAYLDANIQGGTFQWYPAALLAGHEQWGNFLPYLDDYPIPFADDPRFKAMAKMVYEFDPADIGRSYTYPAMARTFRKIGAQFATQFAYDPMYIAPFNTEYQTHYLNLAYAPQKALSMMIAGEAFRRVPLFKDYGSYPDNTRFEGIRVSYEEDLAELVTDEQFLYTNTTTTRPPSPDTLTQIAGCGRSPVVDYPGRGAYFLDRLEPGVWRLEVMPDAIWVRDPYEQATPHKHVSRIAWNEWPMRLELPDLGSDFRAVGLNEGNTFRSTAEHSTLRIRPGTYLLTRSGISTRLGPADRFGNIELREFVAPPASIDRTYVLHEPVVEATAGQNLRITATIAAPQPIEQVTLVAFLPPPAQAEMPASTTPGRAQPGGGNTPGPGGVPYRSQGDEFLMSPVDGFEHVVELPADRLQPGPLRYHITVQTREGVATYPSGSPSQPGAWDFFGEPWSTLLVPPDAPVLLFEAAADVDHVTTDQREVRYELVPSDRPGTRAMEVLANNLAARGHDHSFRFFCKTRIAGRGSDLSSMKHLVLYGRSATGHSCPVQLALITTDGIAYGARATIEPRHAAYSVAISSLKQVPSPNIPQGYPVFIPLWSEAKKQVPFDITRLEAVLVSIGPGLAPEEYNEPHGIEVERLWLE